MPFLKTFKRIIDDETVPEGIPFAVPYDDLDNRKIKISPKVKSIRGKLNVPRERFHLRDRTTISGPAFDFESSMECGMECGDSSPLFHGRDWSRRNSAPVTSHRLQRAGASYRTPKYPT